MTGKISFQSELISMRKNTAFAALIFFLWLLLPASVLANADAPVLRVGYTDVPGYISKGEDGYFRGFIYDYLEAIAVYSDYRLEYVEALPNACLEKLQHGDLDLIAALPEIEHPDGNLIFSHHAITYSPVGIIAHNGKSLAPGEKLRIGFFSHIYAETDIRAALQSYGLKEGSDYILVSFSDMFDMIAQYKNGTLDAYVNASVTHGAEDPIIARLFTRRFSIATRKDHAALMQKIDHAIGELMLLNPHIRGQLFSKHAGQGAPLLLTPDEQAYLAAHPTIAAVASPGQKPYTYFENGEAKASSPSWSGAWKRISASASTSAKQSTAAN